MTRLIRAGAKFGIISTAIEHEVDNLMGWNPPSVQVISQMSARQLDQLSQDIERQMGQWERHQEADRQQETRPARLRANHRLP